MANSGLQTYETIPVTIVMPQVVATPLGATDGAAVSVAALSGRTQKFAVRNGGQLATQFNYYAACTGAASCLITSVSKSASSIAPSATDTITVTYTASATISGVVKLFAKYASDTGFVKDSAWVNAFVPTPSLVTPDGASTSVLGGVSTVQTFVIKNTGAGQAALRLDASCTGAGITAGTCAASASGVFLTSGDSELVTVAYRPAMAAGSGTIVLRATEPTSGVILDSGLVTVTSVAPPLAIVEVPQAFAGATTEKEECLNFSLRRDAAAECGVLRVVHPLPALRSMNTARAPTLVYYYDQALGARTFGVNVTLPPSTPNDVDSISVIYTERQPDGSYGNALTRTYRGSYWYTGTRARRIAIEPRFDSALPSHIVQYRITTRVYRAAGAQDMVPIDAEFTAVQRRKSAFGQGWWLAGLEELQFGQPAGTTSILWMGGDGSTRKYVRDAVNTNLYVARSLERPDSLVYNAAAKTYTRFVGSGLKVVFDSAGRHVSTINRLGHITTFAYEDTTHRLSTISVPPSGANLVYHFYYTSGFLDSVTAPGAQPTARRLVTLTRTIANGVSVVSRITDPDTNHVDFVAPSWASSSGLIEQIVDRRGDTTSFIADDSAETVGLVRSNRTGGGVDSLRLRADRSFGSLPASSQPEPPSLDTVYTYTRDGRGNITRFWTNAFGAVTKIQNALLDTTIVARGDARFAGLVTKVVQPNGHTASARYDDHGNLRSTYDRSPFGDSRDAITRYHWDRAWDFADSVVTPTGLVTRRAYDATTGNRLWEQPGGDTTKQIRYSYLSNGLLQSTTLPNTAASTVLYDSSGNVSETHSPLNYKVFYLRDRLGRDTLVKSQIDTAGTYWQLTRTNYDVMDRETLSQSYGPAINGNPADTLSAFVNTYYNALGQPDSVKRWSSPDNAAIGTLKTGWRYDELGRVVAAIAEDGAIDSTYYDGAGNVVRVKPRNFASFVPMAGDTLPGIKLEYDALNRLIKRKIPSVRYASRNDKGIPKFFGQQGRPDEYQPYPRFPNDSLRGITTPADSAMLGYDKLGNLNKALNRDARVWRTFYPNGVLQAETDSIRTVSEPSTDASFTLHAYTLGYIYDLDGRRTQLNHPTQLVQSAALDHSSYGYDGLTGTLDTVTDVMGQQFRYHYNARGEVDSLFLPQGIYEAYAYDADGNRTRHVVFDPNGAGFARDANWYARNETLRYDARGKVVFTGNPSLNLDTLRVTYDGLGHTRTTALSVGGSNTAGNDFRYTTNETFAGDAFGNLVVKNTQLSDTVMASHNGGWINANFFDPANNAYWHQSSVFIQSYDTATGRYAKQQDYLSVRRDTAEYDAAGNTLFTYQSNHDNSSSLADRISYYSADGHLYAAESRTVSNQSTYNLHRVFEEYRYDALGRRVFVRARRYCFDQNAGECSLSWVRRTVWDGSSELYEIQMPDDSVTTTSGVVLRENDTDSISVGQASIPNNAIDQNPFFGRVAYAYGLTIDQPISITRFRYSDWPYGSGYTWKQYPTFPIVPNWNSRGEIYDLSFGPWLGRMCPASVGTNRCVKVQFPLVWEAYGDATKVPQFFHGTLFVDKVDGTGTMYRRNRTYDPLVGRFTQEDPIGLAGGLNAYGYASGDPVDYSDPFGLCPWYSPYCWRLTPPEALTAAKVIIDMGMKEKWVGIKKGFGVYNTIQDAQDKAKARYKGYHNGKGDAFKHAYLSCKNTQDLGESNAKAIGDAHEDNPYQVKQEFNMDVRNNTVGRTIGARGEDCDRGVTRAMNTGQLQTTLEEDNDTP